MTRLSAVAMCMTGFFVANAVAEDKPTEGKPKLPDMVYVKVSTSLGDFTLELNRLKAPATVDNFLAYADSGHFEGTMFHRIIKDFMIQGGGMTSDYQQKPTRPPVKNEADNGLKNLRGTIAMARTGDPHSATSQFFLNTVDNGFLNHRSKDSGGWGYCVFGWVVDGMDAVEKIRDTPVKMDPRADGGKPAAALEPVLIKKVTRVDGNDPRIRSACEKTRKQYEELMGKAQKQDEAEMKRMTEAKGKAVDEGKNLVKSKGADIGKGQTSPTGLWHVDVTEGSGENPKPSSNVTVHYTGWLTNGTKFDSSKDHGQPISFNLSGVIKGWTEGVGGMKKGGKRFLVIPPELAYGPRAVSIIPPNSTLVFEVELLEIQ